MGKKEESKVDWHQGPSTGQKEGVDATNVEAEAAAILGKGK